VFLGIVRKLSADTAELDTFLMSCRVMGRFIEDQILDQLVKELRADGILQAAGAPHSEQENAPARGFIERLSGGRLLSNDASGTMTWSSTSRRPRR